MTRDLTTIFDNFNTLDPFIGLDTFMDRMTKEIRDFPSYPPYDMYETPDGTIELVFALAGFSKDEIEVSVQNDVLTVQNIRNEEAKEEERTVKHRGIARRDFSFKYSLTDYYKVSECSMENGLLTIKIVREIPEEKKQKVFEIK